MKSMFPDQGWKLVSIPILCMILTLFKTGSGGMLKIQIVSDEIFNDHNNIEDEPKNR